MATNQLRRNRKVYGAAKQREMVRSILPSSSRSGAASALTRHRRRNRRLTAARLARACGPGDRALDLALEDECDLRAYPSDLIREAVWDRRAFDKVAPFQRWAVASTAHLPSHDRLEAVRALVPGDCVGRHALSHLEHLSAFDPQYAHELWWQRLRRETSPRPTPNFEVLVAGVTRCYELGLHGALNAALKRSPDWRVVGPDPAAGAEPEPILRLLKGLHDIEAFVRELDGGPWPRQRKALAAFLRHHLPDSTVALPRRWRPHP